MSDSPTPATDKPLSPRSAKAASLSTSLWSVGLGVAVLAGLYAVNATLFPGKGVEKGKDAVGGPDSGVGTSPPAIASGGNPSAVDPEADAKKQRDDRAAREKLDREQAAARLVPVRARLASLKADGDEVKECLTRYDTLVTVWKAKSEPLRTDEAGKRIAASPTHLASAATVFGRDRATARQRIGWGEQLDQLSAPVLEAERDPNTPVVVHDDTLALTTKLLATVRAAVKGLESDAAVLDVARSATAAMTPAADTLALAFERRLADERAAELKTLEETRVAAVKERADRLAAAERARIVEEGKVEEARVRAKAGEAEFERKKIEIALKAKEEQQKVQLAKEQLLREFDKDLPDIKTYLHAFIGPGYEGRDNKATTKGGVSLKRLRSKGLFEDGQKGIEAMLRYANYDSDRGLGGLPKYSPGVTAWKNLDKEMPIRVQGLLIKYADVLVEKGYLAP